MPFLLDTYNVIHAGSAMGGAFANLNVRRLCQWIVAAPKRQKTTLVLDGRAKPDEPSENEFPELELRYSGTGISADKVIGQVIDRAKNRKALTVVTNDRAVATHARMNYAAAISCEAFLSSLLAAHQSARSTHPPHKLGAPRSPGETDHWLKEFGLSAPLDPPKPPPKTAEEEIDNLDMDQLMGGP